MQASSSYISKAGFEFRGSAREFFGIWIVNLLLSILTLGIYSAWAKVRTKKYFHQNTYVAGRNFDYHANGFQILIGRLIIIAGIVVYTLLSTNALVVLVMVLGLIALIPYLLVRSLRFNARMSSWSNIRFTFHGSFGSAVKVYYLYPFLAALSLYTAWPFATRATQRFLANGHGLGTTRFSFDSAIGPFYKALLAALVWGAGSMMILFAFASTSLDIPRALQALEAGSEEAAALVDIGLLYLIVLVAFAPAAIIYHALVRNTVYNNLTLDERHTFHSSVSPLKLLWISVSNFFVVVLTLGLMMPWAHVRRARYLADHTTLYPGGSLDDFVDEETASGNAVGDAYGDLEGFGIEVAV
ncbi:YjgN family protein [Ruegeria sp. 2012CJ41-6]|uniref:YjgN family protein n=1 Tax=Ruegeria spongiae TaxID=2942209 RepID=A0ABT0Q0Y5_9RHOB|nr:YjgN family protein [Ruegeria spongiae]MCL6283475.1 YjgN family protein [Ruegeria spongiae]